MLHGVRLVHVALLDGQGGSSGGAKRVDQAEGAPRTFSSAITPVVGRVRSSSVMPVHAGAVHAIFSVRRTATSIMVRRSARSVARTAAAPMRPMRRATTLSALVW